MIPVFLLLIPLITGLVTLFIKDAKRAKRWALFSAIITLIVSLTSLCSTNNAALNFDIAWLPDLGTRFTLITDGMG